MPYYNWDIRAILKSGKEETFRYVGKECDSGSVADIFLKPGSNAFFGAEGNKGNIFVNIGEVAVFEVSMPK